MSDFDLSNVPMKCPECGQTSDSLKCYSLPKYIIFIGIYAGYDFERMVCCPKCMRKKILLYYFTYNIIIGNLVWLFLGLPMGLWKLASSFTKGHSKSVQQFLEEQNYTLPSEPRSPFGDSTTGAPSYDAFVNRLSEREA